MKKTSLSVAGLFITCLLCSALFSIGTAQATSSTCFDVTGQGKPVLVSGIANSGIVYFDDPNAPAMQYQACMEDPALDRIGPFNMKGWAWDDNLGWISFYCGDEDGDGSPPYTNLGIACGDYEYGVYMDGPTDATPGRLHGFAFGDAAGYISFNCLDSGTCGSVGYSVTADPITLCVGTVYGTISPSPADCDPHSEDLSYIYAWSDNVGWFNFDGVTFPWVDLTTTPVEISLYITPDPTNPPFAPYADGSSAYTMTLTMKDPDGNPIDPSEYAITATLDWDNHIGTNQVDGADASDAVSPPSEFPVASYDPTDGTIDVTVTSIAPSSLMNKTGDDFFNQTFILPKTGPNVPPAEPNNYLKFNNLLLSVIYDPGTPPAQKNVCLFGEQYTCNPAPFPSAYQGANFNFKPPVQLTQFDDSVNTTFLSLRYLVSSTINSALENLCVGICVSPSAQIKLGLTNETSWGLVRDIAEPEGFGTEDLGSGDFSLGPGSSSIQIGVVCKTPDAGCPAFSEGAYAYSVISYSIGGRQVQYFGNKLPRVSGTLLVNPVAKIVGSVYSTGVTNPQTGTVVRSLGDVSTNILRDTLFNNISSIIAGVQVPAWSAATISGFSNGFTVSSGTVVPLLPDSGGINRVYYFGNDLTIDTGNPATDLSWSGERTIVVIGGNVYIKSNLYNAPGASKPRLGIIVLKDLSVSPVRGGNIYVAPNVTDIQANIFADGSLFSYDPSQPAPVNANGEPYFASESDRFNRLKNQLYLQGSLASLNTIGGAVATPNPILGDGTTTSAGEGGYGSSPSGRSRARLYDLNFIRYYGLVYARQPATSTCPGEAIDQQNPALCPGDAGYEITADPSTATPPGDLVMIEGGQSAKQFQTATEAYLQANAGSMLITFDPPPATLPGFSVTTGAEVQFRPQ